MPKCERCPSLTSDVRKYNGMYYNLCWECTKHEHERQLNLKTIDSKGHDLSAWID